MAIQFTDFSQAPLQDSPWKDLLGNVLKGYEIGQRPAELARKAEEQKLANSIKEESLKRMPEEWALKKRSVEAEINKANRATPGGTVKPSGDVANQVYIDNLESQLGADHPRVVALKKVFDVGLNAKKTNTTSKEKYSTSLAFRQLPVDEKKRAVAMTTGMGYDPIEGERLLTEGKTLSDLAKEKNIDVNDVNPVYPVGGELVKQTQRRGAFVKELVSFDKHIAEGLGDYQNKFLGWSIKQVADATRNLDPDKQGKLLAARALGPELAGLRFKVAGGNLGIEALREMQDKSLTKINILESQVSPEAFKAMNKYMDKWLIEAKDKFDEAINDYGRVHVGEANNRGAMNYESIPEGHPNGQQGHDKVFNPATGRLE